ncbi:MAG TPA: hypothetical protein PKE63_09785, partial [Lacibacter sp.]|nr:hypothetical protein [Lacibacter sp.]
MRIVFLHTAALPAGWTGLIAGWVAHHPQPDVFALTAGGPQPLQAQTVGSSRTGPFPVSWRQNRQLRRLCPDVVVDASATAPLVLKGPRLLLLPDPALLQQLAGPTGPRQAWLRYRLRKKLRQATRVVVPTAFAAAQLHRVIPLHPGQPAVVPLLPGAAFQPLPPAAREAVKEQVTGGVEYFLYTGSLAAGGQVLRLLKAFSAFKKRQQSSMRLVLAGAVPRKQEAAFKKMLSTYKYRA